MNTDLVRRYDVVGSRRISNYFWAIVIGLGGLDFLLTGLSSYLNFNLLSIVHSENIIFFPQGLVMCFYGLLGIFFSLYLSLTILWSVGGGFNLFDKQQGIVRIFRWGFPGKNRRVDLIYPMEEITGVSIEFKEGINPRRTIYLCIKTKGKIPLTRAGQPMTLEEIEILATELAQFLQKDLLI